MAKARDFFKRLLTRQPKHVIARDLESVDPTAGYRAHRYDLNDLLVNELPRWNYRAARLMLGDPVVLLGLATRNAALAPAKIEVECKDARVREFIGRQWDTLWGKHSPVLLRTKHYGFNGIQLGFETDKETRLLEIDGVKEFDPMDVRPIVHKGQPVGFRVVSNQVEHRKYGNVSQVLYAPRAVWLRNEPIAGRICGTSVLRGSYSPWYEKYMPGGALKTRQLRMIKDAYMGDTVYYPFDRSITLPDGGGEVSWRDVIRQAIEARRSGAAMLLPMLYDENGNRLVEHNPPQDTGDPKAIFQWIDDSDRDIWRGLRVFEEVIQAADTGSGFSGRSVPMMMFLASCQDELNDLLQGLVTFALQPLVFHNFGDIKFSVKSVPLVEVWAEDMGGSSMGGGAVGGGPNTPPQQPDPAQPGPPSPGQQPQPNKPPTKQQIQFAEPDEGGTIAAAVDYADSDLIAAKIAREVRKALHVTGSEIWSELQRTNTREQRKWMKGAAAAMAVGAAIVALIARKKQRAQEIVEDGLFAASVVGAGAAQETILQAAKSEVSETSAPAPQPTTVQTQDTAQAPFNPSSVTVAPTYPQPTPAAPVTPQQVANPTPATLPAIPAPPKGKVPSTREAFGRRPRVKFPTEEAARKTLRNSQALAGQNYKITAELVKRDAFSITTRMSDDVVAKIRDELESNMSRGMDLKSFVRKVQGIQRGEQFPLSRARIELVFRANTARYLSDAQNDALSHPMVADMFPYRAYSATHDDRVRDTHFRLEQTGLNGTNIYRADDPAWEAFRPPWAYADRCSWRPVSVRQAARIGVVEANQWLGRASAVAKVQGGLPDQYLSGTRPSAPEFVAWPSIDGEAFYPSPEWSRDGVQFGESLNGADASTSEIAEVLFNDDLSSISTHVDIPESFKQFRERWITVGGRKVGNKKHVGGTPIKIGSDGDVVEPRSKSKDDTKAKKEKPPEPKADPLDTFVDRAKELGELAGYGDLFHDRDRAEKAMGGGMRPNEYAAKLIDEHEQSLAPKQSTEGGTRSSRAPKKGTKLHQKITETIGDDPQDVEYFAEVLYDVLEQQQSTAREYNDLFDNLRVNFVSEKRGRAGGFATQLAKADDPSKVEGFDQITQYVRDNPSYQSLLSIGGDESEGTGDIESRLFEALKAGKRRVPTLNDEEIWSEAMGIVESTMSRASTWDPDEDWSTVDFAEVRKRHWIHTYREYRDEFLQFAEGLLFDKWKAEARSGQRMLWDEDDHPRAEKGSQDDKYKGGRFVPKKRKKKPAPYSQKQEFGPDGKPTSAQPENQDEDADILIGEGSGKVGDYGEHIPGARKHTAVKTGPREETKEQDGKPGWARRYEISLTAASTDKSEVGKWFVYDKRQKGWFGQPKQVGKFDTQEEAEAALPIIAFSRNHVIYSVGKGDNEEYAIFRRLGDRKVARVKGGFPTRDAATEYAARNARELVEYKFPDFDTVRSQYLGRVERKGPARHKGDVSERQFAEKFGVRGAQFGNWTSNRDGQKAINHAYDSLVDMADVLDLDVKDLAFNGRMAMAFGARGRGGANAAAAHYEPDAKVINLTKMNGAGTLSHEWGHAFDHMLSGFGEKLGSENTRAVKREELRDALNSVTDAIKYKQEEYVAEEPSTDRLDYAKERLSNALDQLERQWEPNKYDRRKKKPLSDQQRARWAELRQKLESGEVGEKKIVPGKGKFSYSYSTDVMEEMNDIHKHVTGRKFHTASKDPHVFNAAESVRIQQLAVDDAKAKVGTKQAKKVATEFSENARKLDRGRASSYYQSTDEMFARAFESYIEDKLSARGMQSDYLIGKGTTTVMNEAWGELFGGAPYPKGEERKAIHAAFDNLFAVVRGNELKGR